ncbi:MAG: hypothetical protein HY887_02795 [Deltaproteobacteria bacterium]|nr:hypothetical protein [Deltaproteobacteria bacterium]
MKKTGLAVLAFVVFVLIASHAGAMDAGSVPRITANELKARLDKGEQITIIDVRTRGSYSTSPWKIKGDIRLAPDEISAKATGLPKGALIVAYCT